MPTTTEFVIALEELVAAVRQYQGSLMLSQGARGPRRSAEERLEAALEQSERLLRTRGTRWPDPSSGQP